MNNMDNSPTRERLNDYIEQSNIIHENAPRKICWDNDNVKRQIGVAEEMENEIKDGDTIANLLHHEVDIKPDPDEIKNPTNLRNKNLDSDLFGKVETGDSEAITTILSKSRCEETIMLYCHNCQYTTKNKNTLRKHTKVKHMPHVNWYQCQMCDYSTIDKTKLREHFTARHEAKWHHCQICHYKTKGERYLRRHFKFKHDEETKWEHCQLCDYKTKRPGDLNLHFRTKHDPTSKWHQCVVCDYKTKFISHLKRHFIMKHDEKADWYQCKNCEYKTKRQGHLKRHFTSKHDEEADWHQCQVCDFRTKNKSYLRQHSMVKHCEGTELKHRLSDSKREEEGDRKHDHEKFSDVSDALHDDKNICWDNIKREIPVTEKMGNETKDDNITIATLLHDEVDIKRDPVDVTNPTNLHDENLDTDKSKLREHFTARHEGKWLHCQICHYKTKVEKNFRRHFKLKHDEKTKWVHCQLCDYKTKRPGDLNSHFMTNHDPSPKWYQCVVCDYTTKWISHLKNHFVVKHDEKADWYQCRNCKYRTKCKAHLRRHFTSKHDEEAEWHQCQVCDFRTKNKSYLRQHSMVKHCEGTESKQRLSDSKRNKEGDRKHDHDKFSE